MANHIYPFLYTSQDLILRNRKYRLRAEQDFVRNKESR